MSTKARKGNRLTDVSSAIFAKNYNKRCKNTLKLFGNAKKPLKYQRFFDFNFFIFPTNRKLMIFQNCSYRFLNRFSHRG